MAVVLDRPVQAISMEREGRGVELTVHGGVKGASPSSPGNAKCLLTVHEMRMVAYALLSEAEAISSSN